jgi:hypothetical protein
MMQKNRGLYPARGKKKTAGAFWGAPAAEVSYRRLIRADPGYRQGQAQKENSQTMDTGIRIVADTIPLGWRSVKSKF